MTREELKEVYGGVTLTASILSAIIRGVTTFYDIGRRVGTYLIRYKSNSLCNL